MNTMKIKVVFASLSVLLLLSAVLAACTTQFLDLPILDDSMKIILIEDEINGKVIAVIEAESGKLVQTGPYDKPAVYYNSGAASGGAYVKNISYQSGYVEVPVPIEGTYSLAIGWSGSMTGSVDVTVNPTDPNSTGSGGDKVEHVKYARGSVDWELSDPQYLIVLRDYPFKTGDIIRLNNGLAEGLNGPFNSTDPGGHIHVDALYLFTPIEAE